MLKRFLKNEDGATAVECGMVLALIFVAIITAAALVRGSLDDVFTNVSADLSGARWPPPCGALSAAAGPLFSFTKRRPSGRRFSLRCGFPRLSLKHFLEASRHTS